MQPLGMFEAICWFSLLVQPSGALLWRFRYRMSGIERKMSLRSFPEVTLQQARKKRDIACAELIGGIDPIEPI